MTSIVVVGGGVSGLAAAVTLRRQLPTADITIIDNATRLGGKLRTSEFAGVPLDEGADAFVVRTPQVADLARSVGLEVIHPATGDAHVWTRARLRALPRGTFLGVPGDLGSVAGVLSKPGVLRAAFDAVAPQTALDADTSVRDYVQRRLGAEVVDRLVEPLLGGVYAGRTELLSMQATMPALFDAARTNRSLMRAVRGARSTATGPVFGSVPGGLGAFADALAGASRAHILTGSPVREINREAGKWRLVVGSTRDPVAREADAVVLATPAASASRLLATASPTAAALLSEIEYASVAIVTLAFARTTGWPSGSGYLVPPVEGRSVKAVTFASNKWAHLSRDDVFILRCSIGRHREERDLQRADDELVRLATDELRPVVGDPGALVASRVTRWGGGLPQYAVGHVDRVARIKAAVSALPRLAVCGAAYDGVGIAACAASGQAAAQRIIESCVPTKPAS